MFRRFIALLALSILVAGVAPAAQAEATHTSADADITSNATDAITIKATVFKPAGASAEAPVPMIIHSHGWGGSRSTSLSDFTSYLDAGFGVLSFDQRGHGASGGQANVEDPELEGKDVEAILDYITDLGWVQRNVDAAGNPIATDPVVGAIGGSYGGGYQLIGALTELRDTGRTRFDALAPQITWYDLPESLAPQGVVRSAWTTLLYVGAKKGGTDVPLWVDQALVYGAATGLWPDGTVPATGTEVDKATNIDAVFHEHSPVAFVEDGIQLDIPLLIGQGATDTLFNLNQGIHNFQDTLTDGARLKSIFVGYNDGHEVGAFVPGAAIGETLPAGTNPSGDNCSGGFAQLTINFFKAAFAGKNPRTELQLPAYNFSTVNGTCIRVNSIPDPDDDSLVGYTAYPVNPVGPVPGWGTPTGAGAPVNYKLASGPLKVAGIPRLTGDLFATPDARAFFALSMGTTEQDAKVIQANVMPLRSFPAGLGDAIDIELPGIAAEIPEGQNLYLTITPISDIFFGHGHTPGVIAIGDLAVQVPVVGAN